MEGLSPRQDLLRAFGGTRRRVRVVSPASIS